MRRIGQRTPVQIVGALVVATLALFVSACSSSEQPPADVSRFLSPSVSQTLPSSGAVCASPEVYPPVSAHPAPAQRSPNLAIVGFVFRYDACWNETAILLRGGQDVGYRVEQSTTGQRLIVDAPLTEVWLRTWKKPYELGEGIVSYEGGDATTTVFAIRLTGSQSVRVQSNTDVVGEWEVVIRTTV